MSFWFNDPQLFLYVKGTGPDDVILRRCKVPVSSSSSSLVVPMKSEDFEYVSNVENHLKLIDEQFDWDETDYKRLVKYIHERGLLVNRQGLVITEIYKLDDPNRVPIYIRSLDVLPLKPYIPNIRERLIPSRTVKYLEDVNGKAAMMKEDSNITNLIARVDNLEAENIRLESKNNTLDSKITRLTTDLTNQVTNLVSTVTDLRRGVTLLIRHSYEMDPAYKEVWMNDHKQYDWVGVDVLTDQGPHGDLNCKYFARQGSYDSKFLYKLRYANVRATYFRGAQGHLPDGYLWDAVVILVEDLTPHKEKARFCNSNWYTGKLQGKLCVISNYN